MKEIKMDKIICAANAHTMKYYFNEGDFSKLPEAVRQELKLICVSYCSDVGGIISIGFDDEKKLCINTMEPTDEIGSELLISRMRKRNAELFEQLETFAGHFL